MWADIIMIGYQEEANRRGGGGGGKGVGSACSYPRDVYRKELGPGQTPSTFDSTQHRSTLLNPACLPFKPQHAYSPHCSPYISYTTSWENLIKHQHISCLMIISLILMTCTVNQLVIL